MAIIGGSVINIDLPGETNPVKPELFAVPTEAVHCASSAKSGQKGFFGRLRGSISCWLSGTHQYLLS